MALATFIFWCGRNQYVHVPPTRKTGETGFLPVFWYALTNQGKKKAGQGFFSAALGKVMLLKLRRDFKENQGSKYSLRAFHDAMLANGSAPLWAQRRFLLNETSDAALE